MDYFDTVYNVLEKWYRDFAGFTPKLIVGAILFFAFYFLSTTLSKITVKTINKMFPKSRQQESVKALVNIFKFLFILAGAFLAFEVMGLNGFVLKFIGSLGVAGIIAGVALKDIVSSMFSGMLVGIDKSFKDGDNVQINGITGTVEDIGFLTTKLIADDGKKYYIPNQIIFSAPFINFTASGVRKVVLNLEIPNTENLEKITDFIKDEVTKLTNLDRPEDVEIVFQKQSLGIYYLDVKFWVKKGTNLLKTQSNAYVQIKKRLDAEGISMVNPLNNLAGNPPS